MKSYTDLIRHKGNEVLFDVVEMGVMACLWNAGLHIHVEGLRGTGKTTIMRAAQRLLPQIERVKGCLYNCHPEYPHCPIHSGLSKAELDIIGTEQVPRPFLEISHSAKIGTVAGSIDLAKITNPDNPAAAILPGIIPQAHRGIIFIDEINRLADTSPEITDLLLDLMGTKPGRVQIEETGLPVVQIPVQVSVWAASNPDEDPGPLQEVRRQLSDRFDLVIDMGRTKDADAIASILQQSELTRQGQWVGDNQEPVRKVVDGDRQVGSKLQRLAVKYRSMQTPEYLRNYIARIYVKYGFESIRSIEAIQLGALLNTALREGDQMLIGDVLRILPLALQHRVDVTTITKIVSGQDLSKASNSKVGTSPPTSGSKVSNEGVLDKKNNVPGRSLLDPFKDLLNSRTTNSKNKDGLAMDEITASPPDKAKRINQIRQEELVKTEEELRYTV